MRCIAPIPLSSPRRCSATRRAASNSTAQRPNGAFCSTKASSSVVAALPSLRLAVASATRLRVGSQLAHVSRPCADRALTVTSRALQLHVRDQVVRSAPAVDLLRRPLRLCNPRIAAAQQSRGQLHIPGRLRCSVGAAERRQQPCAHQPVEQAGPGQRAVYRASCARHHDRV